MPDYKAMYLHLAGQVASAIELLTQAQLACEAAAMEEARAPLAIAPGGGDEEAPPGGNPAPSRRQP